MTHREIAAEIVSCLRIEGKRPSRVAIRSAYGFFAATKDYCACAIDSSAGDERWNSAFRSKRKLPLPTGSCEWTSRTEDWLVMVRSKRWSPCDISRRAHNIAFEVQPATTWNRSLWQFRRVRTLGWPITATLSDYISPASPCHRSGGRDNESLRGYPRSESTGRKRLENR